MFPILFQSNSFILYSYPLFMGLGWGIGYQILFEFLPDSLTRIRAQALFWGLFVFAWLGAKFFFLYTVPHDLSVSLLQESSFWLGGGFVFYGGLLGGLFYLLILKGMKFPVNRKILFSLLPALTLGHAVGRFGCFLAGCCYGKETSWWWSISMHGAHRHPTQLLEFVFLLSLGIFLLRSKSKHLMSIYFVSYGLMRLFVESLRGDSIRGVWGPLTPSQWVSLVLMITGGLIYISNSRHLKGIN
jgi:phosphatidylglycerol:prolipoprotein diacylglycerol transferase